jgi:hypothetical protein
LVSICMRGLAYFFCVHEKNISAVQIATAVIFFMIPNTPILLRQRLRRF